MSAPARVVVVGASLAAARTIRALRRKGYDGDITLVGAEPHLPYDRPPLSKQFLAGDLEQTDLRLGRDDLYADVDLRLGAPATRLLPAERRVELSDGTSVTGDDVIVATGASPRRLPDQPDLDGVFVLRTVDHAQALRDALDARPERVVVVGAGFIGSEVASTARARGLDVTVLEADAAPVVRGVGPVIGGALGSLHRRSGIDLRLSTAVAAIDGDRRASSVRLADGSRVPADVVVVGIGVVPATRWLEGSGVTIDDGVLTDERCRVVGGGGHVWALGDVARWPSARYGEVLRIEHWTNATEQAAVVAANLLDPATGPTHDPVPYVWSDQFGHKVQVLGRVSGDEDVEVVNGALDGERYVAAFVRDGRLRGVVGLSWPAALMSYRTLVAQGADRDAVRAHADSLEH